MTDWDADFDAQWTCPICGSGIMLPAGNEHSPYLIIGTYPDIDAVKEHAPIAGRSMGVLKAELRRFGRDVSEFRVTNLWSHIPNDKKDKNYEKCFQQGVTSAIKEAISRKAILLLGAETTKFLCGVSAENYNGLQITSQYLSCPNIYACINPTNVFRGGIGEVRLSLSKFVKMLERIENEQ